MVELVELRPEGGGLRVIGSPYVSYEAVEAAYY